MLSKYKMMVLAAATCTLLGMESAQAALYNVNFTDALGRTMVLTYDETAPGTRPDPFGVSGGISYDAVSFTFDGTPVADPSITFYDNWPNGFDYIYLLANSNAALTTLEMHIDTINGSSLTQLKTLGFGNTIPGDTTFSYSGQTSPLTSLTVTAVPEPSAALLGLLGVVVGAFTRKRRA